MATNETTPTYYFNFMQRIYAMMEEHKTEQPGDYPAMMAYNTAVDLVDGMFKGLSGLDEIRATYDSFIAAMHNNAAFEAYDESMASAADAYRKIAREAKLAKEGK